MEMANENKEGGRPGPKPESQEPTVVPQPRSPFEPKPAHYKPDEVIKVWKADPPKENNE